MCILFYDILPSFGESRRNHTHVEIMFLKVS